MKPTQRQCNYTLSLIKNGDYDTLIEAYSTSPSHRNKLEQLEQNLTYLLENDLVQFNEYGDLTPTGANNEN
ncbi:hypothetical protein N9045_01175 [bacterium]|nr:hypothetical protein [bacterium]